MMYKNCEIRKSIITVEGRYEKQFTEYRMEECEMAAVQWIKIIIAILELIAEGADKQTAVSRVAQRFGVSENSIWNHGGF